MPLTPQARSVYRALLREHPRRNLLSPTSSSANTNTSTTTPLHNHLRELFRSGAPTPTTEARTTAPTAQSKSRKEKEEESEIEYQRGLQRIQEAQQVAQYARAQRTYMSLLETYYPGMSMDEEERVRLTARKVGFDLPVVAEGQ